MGYDWLIEYDFLSRLWLGSVLSTCQLLNVIAMAGVQPLGSTIFVLPVHIFHNRNPLS